MIASPYDTDLTDAQWAVLSPCFQEFPHIVVVWVDQGYTGTGRAWIEDHLRWRADVVARSAPRRWMILCDGTVENVPAVRGFAVLPRQWVVERTQTEYP